MSKQHTHELSFVAGLYKLDAAAKKATFYLMNTSRNRNRWAVTEKALDEAMPTLIKKPLGMGKDYKVGHFPDEDSMDCGVFSSFENKGNYALGTVDIKDEKTLQMLIDGKLGPVSSVIYPYYDTCSRCGAALDEKWMEHECIASNEGYSVIHSFEFHRFDFVDVPAYPQAGFMNFAAHKDGAVPLALLAGVYESSVSKITENKKLSEKENEKIAALEQSNEKLDADLKKAQKSADDNKTKVDELSAKLKQIEDERHTGLVEQAYKTRAEAGVAGKADEEKVMLAALSDSTLKVFIADAQKVAKVVVSAKGRPVPEIEFTAENQEGLAAAVEAERERMGFAARKTEGAE